MSNSSGVCFFPFIRANFMDVFVSLFSQKKININPTHIFDSFLRRGVALNKKYRCSNLNQRLPALIFRCVNSKEVTNLSH